MDTLSFTQHGQQQTNFEEPVGELLKFARKERRLVGRLLAYWHHLCEGRDFPALVDIDPAQIGDDWRWSFILDTAAYREIPNFSYIGPDIAKYSGIYLSGQDSFTSTILDLATHRLSRVFAEGCPLLIEDDVVRFDGKRLMFRAVLLPLSDDGKTINFVMGAANAKLEDGPTLASIIQRS